MLRAALIARDRASAAAPSASPTCRPKSSSSRSICWCASPTSKASSARLPKTMVEESESHTCAVWLIDDEQQRCELWMAYVKDRLFTPERRLGARTRRRRKRFPCESMASHLFEYAPGWSETVEYSGDDARLPEPIRAFSRRDGVQPRSSPRRSSSAPATLGWMTVCSHRTSEPGAEWWRVVADRGDRAAGGAGAAPQPAGRAATASRSGARPSSRSATASRATFTTTWRRDSRRS